MRLLRRPALSVILLAVVSFLLAVAAQAQTPAVTTFARLGGTPDGFHPQSALIAGSDGFFYGTTGAGGPANCGTIYRVAPDGTFATIYAFTGGSDGANPKAALVAGGDGFFYGTAASGGANGTGTVFKISPAGAFTSLYNFGAYDAQFHNADGAAPQAALVAGGDGFFYGTAASGGITGGGAIFRISPGGALNVVYQFSAFSTGTVPKAALTPGGDGFFYGVTSSGGTASGVVFRVASTGGYQVLYNFGNGADGGSPASTLVLANGVFYGLTNKTFFSVTPTGALNTLHTFAVTEGGSPFGGLTAGADGNLYGTAGQRGPTGNFGTIFQATPAGAVTVLYAFQNRADGANPVTPPLQGADGNFYGVASAGFNGNFSSGGTVYQLTPAGALTTLHTFNAGGSFCAAALLQAADGDFYGVTSQGGAKNGGTIFAVSANGSSMATLHDFDPDTEGSRPRSALVQTSDGTIYGTTNANGPAGGGTIFHLAAASQTRAAIQRVQASGAEEKSAHGPRPAFAPALGFVLEHSLSKQVNFGSNPFAYFVFNTSPPLVSRLATSASASAATFYGVTQIGGDGGAGGVFSYTPGGTPTGLHVFGLTADDGKLAEGLVEGADLNLYGVTNGGGAAGVGTIFKISADGSAYSVLYSFKGAGDGAFPQAGLVAGSDGALYGATTYTSYNAATVALSGSGTIFKITPDGTFTTLHTFADSGAEGNQPMGALTSASDGNLYGTTSGGGTSFAGTVFSITTGGVFKSLYSFNGQNGGQIPIAPMIQATDGNLYGTTSAGGTDGAGVVFKVALNAAPALPTVSVAATTPNTSVGSSEPGVFTLTLSAAQTTDMLVHYTVKGSAANGTDYAFLKGTAKIKAGKTVKPVRVKPLGDLGGAAKKAVAFTLAPDSAYTIDTPEKVKVKIFNP